MKAQTDPNTRRYIETAGEASELCEKLAKHLPKIEESEWVLNVIIHMDFDETGYTATIITGKKVTKTWEYQEIDD